MAGTASRIDLEHLPEGRGLGDIDTGNPTEEQCLKLCPKSGKGSGVCMGMCRMGLFGDSSTILAKRDSSCNSPHAPNGRVWPNPEFPQNQ